ncbi:hypothetical protein EYF80_034433 [Liparis tanakae]|uniref:Uncharacterized protein n=1 Tax=Liparis tanakae TaxID=230148 RepID=A0A4Z2GQ60_9TELE|nr:hypothetical protein EYF80_034433 [Liparis tanakae]
MALAPLASEDTGGVPGGRVPSVPGRTGSEQMCVSGLVLKSAGRDPPGQACMHGRPEKTSAPSTTSMPPNTRPSFSHILGTNRTRIHNDDEMKPHAFFVLPSHDFVLKW